ncbi:hypothetical protein I79_004651 [Cricetulus griseus]|uniref:Uncharacterized protein n=1 Tax=Cricetulus griseus TaxID=10029 RepID=G3H342_CRIGR|nr:hypothetical protein I79_004651 [Cricetulus griseus]
MSQRHLMLKDKGQQSHSTGIAVCSELRTRVSHHWPKWDLSQQCKKTLISSKEQSAV